MSKWKHRNCIIELTPSELIPNMVTITKTPKVAAMTIVIIGIGTHTAYIRSGERPSPSPRLIQPPCKSTELISGQPPP